MTSHSRPPYASLTTNASDWIGNIGCYLLSYSHTSQESFETSSTLAQVPALNHLDHGSSSHQQEAFMKQIERLQREQIVSNFVPCSVRTTNSLSTTYTRSINSFSSSHVPEGSVLQRVCDDCACALQQRHQHYNTMRVFELCEFDLKELRVLGQVCRRWHRASVMCLSTFRQIQYYLPTHRLSKKEKKLLIINRRFLSGHTKWLLQLLKAVDFSQEDIDSTEGAQLIEQVFAILQQPRQYKCMLTMCSRLCKSAVGSVDALEILSDERVRNHRIRAMSVDALTNTATENEWLSFLPVLLHSLSLELNAIQSNLGIALIRQAQRNVRFCYDLYWGLTVMSEDPSWRRKFDGMRQRLLLQIASFALNGPYENLAEQLLRGQEFVDLLWKLPARDEVANTKESLQLCIVKSKIFDLLQPLRLPVDPFVCVSGIDYDVLEIKRSAEAPMIITCTGAVREVHEPTEGLEGLESEQAWNQNTRLTPSSALSTYRIMYKRDDLRKDAIVQNIINVMYLILKQETRLDIPLVTYRVLPTSSFDGLIEIVEDAHTLYSIIRDHSNILNFLHHYNGHRTLSEISGSFRESLAAYTVITFLLGVGDRHADNVMLTKDGILFHIDYGFILGKDPKPLQPPMRLDHFMIEALGGTQTQQYEQFKQLCVIAFNCLRRHVSLFMIMLSLVVKAIPEITDFGMNYTRSDLEAFVVERFLPGQSDEEAATALMLRMEGKFNEKIGLQLSDFVHAHANEKTVSKGMLSVGSSVKLGVETVEATVSTVASSITQGASSIYKYMWGTS